MSDPAPAVEWWTYSWRLGVTLLFVAANGFFVAAEFALVKVRGTRLDAMAADGSSRARVALHLYTHLNHYLSACQLGITISSLILGWLAEPAVAELLLAGAAATGLVVAVNDALLHGIALALALTVVTVLHMTIGEQAPKIWAIQRAESIALLVAYPLRLFEVVFRPFIWLVNTVSNATLRIWGLSESALSEGAHTVEELKAVLATAASAGNITPRQRELAENVFGLIGLEVRHILVPRVDIVFLSVDQTKEENLAAIRDSGHSRLPLCQVGLDTVIGIVHTKDVMRALLAGEAPDLERIAREPIFVPDTQPLSRMILRMQAARKHCALVVDERGTVIGMVFLEDAIEELIGPLADEFDESTPGPERAEDGSMVLPGELPLPEAVELLDLPSVAEESDTIGGHVVSLLGRMPQKGDKVQVGPYRATVLRVSRRRIDRVRFEPTEG